MKNKKVLAIVMAVMTAASALVGCGSTGATAPTDTAATTVKKDDLLQAYTRAYKAHYARMTKPRKKAANMTREAFEAWYKQAKEGLEMARQGKVDPEAY